MRRNLFIWLTVLAMASSIFTPFSFSNTYSLTPTFSLEVTPGCGYNVLKWEKVTGATNYWIYRGPSEGAEFDTPLTDFPIPDNTFKDDINIINGTKYCYFVRAVDANANEFAQSKEACGTPTCENPPEEIPPENEDCRLMLEYQIGNKYYKSGDVQKGPMESAPLLTQNRMFLLIRYVAEEVGASIAYDATTKIVIIKTLDGQTLEIQIGNPTAKVNGSPVQIDPNNPQVVAFIVGGRTVLPMRFVAENLGATGPEDIKWFEATKIVQLLFGDPNCRRCMCVTVSKVDCNAKPPVVYGKDANGKEWRIYLSKELCLKVKEGGCYTFCGSIRQGASTPTTATALNTYFIATVVKPTDCPCKQEPYPDYKCMCVTIETQNCSANPPTVYGVDEKNQKWVLQVDASLCQQMTSGTCWKVCGTVAVTTVTAIANLPPVMKVTRAVKVDCPCGGNQAPRCLCMKIEKVDCASAPPMAWGTDKNGKPWVMELDEKMCLELKPGSCYIICGHVQPQSTATTYVQAKRIKVVRFEKIECEQCKPDEKCFCVKIDRVDCNAAQPTVYGYDENGKLWALYVDSKWCADMQPGTCWRVCGNPPEIIRVDSLPWMKVTRAEKIDCSKCPVKEQKENCICLTVERVDCNSDKPMLYGKDENGKFFSLLLSKELCEKYSNYLVPGKCLKVCYIITDSTLAVTMKVTSIAPVECPCEAQKEKCLCITLERVDCTSENPTALGKDESGQTRWSLGLSKELCAKYANYLVPGKCLKVCGVPKPSPLSSALYMEVTSITPVECPCKEETKLDCFCVKIEKKDCENLLLYATIDGKTLILSVSAELCKMAEPGTCWWVCGRKVEVAGAVPYFKVEKYEKRDCPCGTEQPKEECFCVTIDRFACDQDPPMIWGKDKKGNQVVLVVSKEICLKYAEALGPGKCVEICAIKTTLASGLVVWKVTKISQTNCPCEEKPPEEICRCVTIKKVDCTAKPPMVWGVDENGNEITLALESWMCDRYANYLVPEKCIKVCGVWSKIAISDTVSIEVLKLTKIVPVECPCKQGPKPDCFCIQVEKKDCERGILYAKIGEKTIMLMVPPELCKMAEPGTCWWVCGEWSEQVSAAPYFKVTKFEKRDCPCEKPPEEICHCVTLRKVDCNSDPPIAMGVDENGNEINILLTKELCEKFGDKLSPGKCFKVCGKMVKVALAPNVDALALKLTYINQVDCPCVQLPKEECFCVTIEKISCESDPPMIWGKDKAGNAIVLVLSKELCDKYANYLVSGKCIEVCGTKTTLADGQIAWKLSLIKMVDCPCGEKPPEEICHCVTIKKVDCTAKPPMVWGVDENGNEITLVLESWMCDRYANYLVPEKCIKVCGIWSKIAISDTVSIKVLKLTKIYPVDCPCKEQEPDCFCMEVLRRDCEKGILYVKIGEKTVMMTVPADLCKMAEVGTCWWVCGEWVENPGAAPSFKLLKIEKRDCPCEKPPEEICHCVTIRKVDCTREPPLVWGVDENGNEIVLVLSKELCQKWANYIVPGRCVKVCGQMVKYPIDASTTGLGLKITKLEPTECPCQETQKEECICLEITDSSCGEGKYVAYGKQSNGRTWMLELGPDICKLFVKGTCWKVCGIVTAPTTRGGPAKMKVTKYEKVDCPCDSGQTECYCLTVLKADCNANPPVLYTKDAKGREIKVILTSDMLRICYLAKPGTCWKVCGKLTRLDSGEYVIYASTITAIDCPCAGSQDCKWIRGIVSYVRYANNKWQIGFKRCDGTETVYVANEDLIDITRKYKLSQYKGCAELCINDNNEIVGWKALPDQDCCPK